MFHHATVAIKVRNRFKKNVERSKRTLIKTGDNPIENVENWLKSQIGVQGSCKDFVEAHIAEKCQNRSDAGKRFKWDFFMFTTYSLFLILYSFSACSTNMKGKLIARNLLEAEIGNFDDVQVIGEFAFDLHLGQSIIFPLFFFLGDVYDFLETTTIPMVSEGGL